jgi:TP901 family phage tail tape measure protein
MSNDVRIFLKSVSDLTGITRLGRAVRDHIPGVKALATAYKGVASAIKTAADVGNRGLRTLRNGTLALTAATAASVREFATFNVGMARAWTMMGGGIQQFREMRKQIVNMSADLGIAKDQLTSGLYQALSAGVPQDNALSFLNTAAKVAIADGSSIETAVDGITTVLNAWGLEASQTEAVTDMLFKTVANGKTTFGQLAGSISQAAPVAAAMGVEVNEVLAAVATLTKQGTPTATAMVQIRNALTMVNDQLGDGWSKTMTFQEALQAIAETAGHSQNALTKIFGRETMAAVAALTGANFSSAQADLEAMGQSGGSLDAAFTKMADEIQHWPQILQTVRAYFSDIGEAVETRIRPALRNITEALNNFRQTDTFKSFADGFGETVSEFVNKLLAGVVTAGQVLKAAWSNGPAAFAATLKVALTEAFTLAGTAFIEFIRANITVFVAIARIVAATLKEEILKLNLPGIGSARLSGAEKNADTMTREEGIAMGLPAHLAGNLADNRLGRGARAAFLRDNPDIAAAIAARTAPEDLQNALTDAQTAMGNSAGRMRDQIGKSGQNISATATAGLGIDIPQMYADNRAAIEAYSRPGEAGPSAPGGSAKPAADTTAAAVAGSGQAVTAALADVAEKTRENNARILNVLGRMKEDQETLQTQLQNQDI